jgi:hypothetical protein
MEENMHTTRLSYALLISLVSLGIVAIIVLTGCQPKSTQDPTQVLTQAPITPPESTATPLPVQCDPITASNDSGLTILTLPDGSQIYLAENTEIDFTPAGYCPGLGEHSILLKQGRVAVHSLLPDSNWIVISSPDGYLARIGDTGLVTFDTAGSGFMLACTNGTCALGMNAENLVMLTCGERGDLDAAGNFTGPAGIELAVLSQFGEWLQPNCGPSQTSTPPSPAGTPEAAATATAYCTSFQSQFPLTPCAPKP